MNSQSGDGRARNEEPPQVVQRMVEALTFRLGRPASCRKVKNLQEWFVYDPVFSFIQKGMKKGATGYRVGYWLNFSDWFNFGNQPHFLFCLVHSPLMAKLFKHNLVVSSLLDVIQRTAEFRESHWLYRSSRVAQRHGHDGDRIEAGSAAELVAQIQDFNEAHDFIKDMFPRTWSRGKKGTLGKHARYAGNTFYLPLCDKPAALDSRAAVTRLVESSWPLLLCLYPIEPIERRYTDLARNLRSKSILRVCEFGAIRFPPGAAINGLCRGEVQGAHILPDSKGGSDRIENGLWLCEYHHRITEGHLSGRRGGLVLDVRYIP